MMSLSGGFIELLDLAGERAKALEWRIAGVTATGERCMELEALGDPATKVSSSKLLELARAVSQVIEGEFVGHEPGMREPWILVRAFDSSYWLNPVSLAFSSRFSSRELRRLERLVVEHRQQILKAWHEFFGA